MKQTRQPVRAIKHSIYLDVYGTKGLSLAGWPEDMKKSPNFSKSSQNSLQVKFSTTYLYLKVQNIYIKPL